MRILLTGATGFIGRHIAARLIEAGHELVCCVRDRRRGARLFPHQTVVACDFNRDTAASAWLPRLEGANAVINCAGILQGRPGQSIEAIHSAAPRALFDACLAAGVRRVIQISALGADAGAGTAYADTKRDADRYLQTLDLDWTILQPSLVYTPAGSYGGTSLFRALAALPFRLPVVGDGGQLFQPIHMDDLADGVRRLVEAPDPPRAVIAASGPEPLSLAEILIALRAWLGLPPARLLHLPVGLAAAGARLGDLVGAGPVNSTSLRMLAYGNTADPGPYTQATGIELRRFGDALTAAPAHVQDRWHARLYFLRPLLRLTLALFWIAGGLVAVLPGVRTNAEAHLIAAAVPAAIAPAALWAAALADMALGVLLLVRWRVVLVGALQILLILAYLAWLTLALPGLWGDPLGPLTKAVPLIVATLVMMAIEDER